MDIEKIAKASMLELTEDEKEQFRREISEIVQAFSKISELETSVDSTFQPFLTPVSLREDSVEKGISQKRALRDLKNKEDGFIKGPKTV